MSKKYTFKTESENNFECDSPSTSNCNSANSKSSLSVHLSNTEDAKTGSSNNNTFEHQVLTSNSNSHSNIAIETLTNDRSYNASHTSCSSLDEDLYGTSETFNKNLNSIKLKLQELELINRERFNYNQSSSRSGTSENDNAYSSNSEGNSSDSGKVKGYLSTKNAVFDLDEYIISEKYNSGTPTTYRSCFSHTPITPIDELPALEAIQEVEENEEGNDYSSLHYEVPNKKLCLRAITPRFESFHAIPQKSDINLNKGDYTDSAVETKTLHKNVSNSSSTKNSKPSTSKTLVSNISAFGTDSSSSKEYKYANLVTQDDDNLNATNSNQTKLEEEICSNNSSSSISSINSHSKSKENFINKNFYKIIQKMEKEKIKSESLKNVNTEATSDLHLNLPSSIVDDSSSYKKSPVEPNIIVLKKYEGKRRKKYLKNKVGPDLESQGLENSDSCSSSMSNVNEMTRLYQRYYETTPEMSSRTNSSPSCILSASNRSLSVKSKSETQHITKLSQRSSAPSSPQSNFSKRNIIDSSVIASLDVPTIGQQQNYHFPSITKITIYPDIFSNRAFKCDVDIESDNHRSESSDKITQVQVQYSCYTDSAKMLINSPTISPIRNVETVIQINHGYGDLRPPNREIAECTHFKEKSIRNTQSTDLAFYKLPSECDSSEDLANKRIMVNTTHRTIPQDISAEKKCKKCCCFIFFSKRSRRFF